MLALRGAGDGNRHEVFVPDGFIVDPIGARLERAS